MEGQDSLPPILQAVMAHMVCSRGYVSPSSPTRSEEGLCQGHALAVRLGPGTGTAFGCRHSTASESVPGCPGAPRMRSGAKVCISPAGTDLLEKRAARQQRWHRVLRSSCHPGGEANKFKHHCHPPLGPGLSLCPCWVCHGVEWRPFSLPLP